MPSRIPAPPPPTGLEHLTKLNTSVFLSTPSASSTSLSSPSLSPSSSSSSSQSLPSKPPTLILLCTWMSAPPRPISKYVACYNTIYPSTPLLLIRTSAFNAVYHSHSANLARISPVLEALLKLPSDARILLHLFSNGGAFTTTLVLEEYKKRRGRTLDIDLLVLDSAPGRARLRSTVRAFVFGLPVSWRRWKVVEGMVSLILAVLFTVYKAGYFLSGWILMRKWKGDLVTRTRKVLNDREVVDGRMRRLYVYSEGDELVDWRDVEDHMVEANERGWRVEKERFGMESGHVGHMIVDRQRYWGAVRRAWEGQGERQAE